MSVIAKHPTYLLAAFLTALFVTPTVLAEACTGAPCLLKARDLGEGLISTAFVTVGLPLMSSHQTTESSSSGWSGYAAAVADDAAVVVASQGEIKGPYFESARLRFKEQENPASHLGDVEFAAMLLAASPVSVIKR
ncbi:DUF2388 domain-containing protein [Stutzerimonas stutzeri]|uniref:DUF2388 domain-containing protein n=1 Tax=Stutzerimonas stutzeri TaxID=316 RepID=UPI0021092417|nr:DUF2388 domain-containing protein [Stutzerimonas stutzeri]MCQ4260099.1 DUF2388 domain-containing protein [Stutzerimonas stutzeri]